MRKPALRSLLHGVPWTFAPAVQIQKLIFCKRKETKKCALPEIHLRAAAQYLYRGPVAAVREKTES